jgi:hypothetical protein
VRPSRLFTSTTKYVLLQGANVLRITALYKPMKIFSIAGGLFLLAGVLLGLRFLCYYFFGANPAGHVQSLILSAVLIVVGMQTFSDRAAGRHRGDQPALAGGDEAEEDPEDRSRAVSTDILSATAN